MASLVSRVGTIESAAWRAESITKKRAPLVLGMNSDNLIHAMLSNLVAQSNVKSENDKRTLWSANDRLLFSIQEETKSSRPEARAKGMGNVSPRILLIRKSSSDSRGKRNSTILWALVLTGIATIGNSLFCILKMFARTLHYATDSMKEYRRYVFLVLKRKHSNEGSTC